LAFYRQLLEIRKQKIVPRLAGLIENRSSLKIISPRAFLASWQLKGEAKLSLVANLGDEALEQASELEGDLLYATSDQVGPSWSKLLPAWSAAWFLRE
jgi:hypothetical protein